MRRNSIVQPPELPELNVVLLGQMGAGKSASGNTIIGDRDTFKEGFFWECHTEICQPAHTKVGGQKINVIDTIGLPDPTKTETETLNKMEQICDFARDGLDVFLLVIKLGEKNTKEEQDNMKHMWTEEIFGVKFLRHTLVLFTHGDILPESIEECLSKCDALRSVVDHCAGRHHVFNNRDKDQAQVTELLKKMESLRKMNRDKRYTKQDYDDNQKKHRDEKAERDAAKEEQERILKEGVEAAKKQERLMSKAEEERERLLNKGVDAAKEQERLLGKAEEERERLLKKAEEDRERLLKEAKKQERLFRKLEEERERLLKEAEKAAAANEQEQLLTAILGG